MSSPSRSHAGTRVDVPRKHAPSSFFPTGSPATGLCRWGGSKRQPGDSLPGHVYSDSAPVGAVAFVLSLATRLPSSPLWLTLSSAQCTAMFPVLNNIPTEVSCNVSDITCSVRISHVGYFLRASVRPELWHKSRKHHNTPLPGCAPLADPGLTRKSGGSRA